MSIGSKRELVAEVSPRYRKSDKAEKGRILDELVRTSGYSRKHALRLLGNPPPAKRPKQKRRRERTYAEPEIEALRRLWPVSGHLGSRRLVAALGPLMEALELHGEWVPDPPVRARLERMSASTCGRLLKRIRPAPRPKGMSSTRPGTLKRQIAIRRGTDWDDGRPGFVEADLVSHCGGEMSGDFFFTLTVTDVATGWTELAALRNKGQLETLANVKGIRARLPFALLGIDSDNGSEFVNRHLASYCLEERIVFTRSRPFAKNDGCRVEQKNWAVVRRHLGYGRLSTPEHFKALKEIQGILRLLVNFFEPSSKLVRKERTDKGVRKVYDEPKTPYRRVLDSEAVGEDAKAGLEETYRALNPAALRRRLNALKRDIWEEPLVSLLDEASI